MSQTKAQLIDPVDGTIVNADINASAAIAGTKISPDFGSQNTTTTGIGAFGELQVTSTAPKITFFDSDTNPDFEIRNLNGVLHFKDVSSTAVRMQINTDGHVDIPGNLDVEAGLDVTGGGLTVNSGTTNTCATFTSTDSGAVINITDDSARSSIEQNGTDLKIISDTDAGDDSSTIKFLVDNSTKMTLDSSGRLLLGTTTEGHANGDDLTIATSGDTGISIRSGTSNAGNIYFSDGTSGNDEIRGFISYGHNVNNMYFATEATTRLQINDIGNVEITTEVAANGNTGLILDTNNTSNCSSLLFQAGGENRAQLQVQRVAGDGGFIALQVARTDNSNSLVNVFTTTCATSGDTTPDLTLFGNLVVSNGNGIDFSAQTATSATGASTSSEVFDHYEEGTFSPISPSLTLTTGTGHYTRIGRYVMASIVVVIPSNSNGNQFVIDGLPFNCRSYSGTFHNGGYVAWTQYNNRTFVLCHDNSDRVQVYSPAGNAITLTNLDNQQFRVQVHYFVD